MTHTRRHFLQATVATVAAPYVMTGRVWPAPSERITMGLIGCGGMGGANLHGFMQIPEVQVLGVCDPDGSRLTATKRRVEAVYVDGQKMYGGEE